MVDNALFLFAGTKFDRKKIASDLSRFEKGIAVRGSVDYSSFFKADQSESESKVSKKRKKHDNREVIEERIHVFKRSSKLMEEAKKEGKCKNDEDQILKEKKALNKKIERDAVLRKEYQIHVSEKSVPPPLKSFGELCSRYGCESYLLHNFAEHGFKEPTPIQRQAIPILLNGRDLLARAPTGSGKTLAFVCPMLMKLKISSREGIRALILCPTRELAEQTVRECKRIAKGKKFFIKLMTKDLARNPDFSKIPCDVLVSTPLRLKLAVRKKKIDLSKVEYLVLDESDKLFEGVLLKQIDSIVQACSNPSIIRSLFSATLPESVEDMARTIMHDAVRVVIGRRFTASESVKQRLLYAGNEEGKLVALRQTFAKSLNPPVLIFVQNKERAQELYGELKFEDVRVDVIHSDLSQTQRENAVAKYREGKTWVLIATDLVGRGMDFKGVKCVINYDFPDSAASYIHRIGRSGRAGRAGEAVTLYTDADVPHLRSMTNLMVQSGCTVPSWLLNLNKSKWKRHLPDREHISTAPTPVE